MSRNQSSSIGAVVAVVVSIGLLCIVGLCGGGLFFWYAVQIDSSLPTTTPPVQIVEEPQQPAKAMPVAEPSSPPSPDAAPSP